MQENLKFFPSGDDSIIIRFGNEIKEEINQKIRKYLYGIKELNYPGIIEVIPSYCDLNIVYDNENYYYEDIFDELIKLEDNLDKIAIPEAETIEIPVVYGGEFGPDLENVAKHNSISTEEVVRLHSQDRYLIYMLGFTPGFPYLGGMSEKIATPRLKEPREKIWAGSVGIAGSQTGIYPIESPGGWQIIGRTPLELFDKDRDEEFLLNAGNYIKFKPISEDEYLRIKGEIDEK